jgi:hypothetical protein
MDRDRLLAVTVQVSQADYNAMIEHFDQDKGGRPVVAIHAVVQRNEFAERERRERGESS